MNPTDPIEISIAPELATAVATFCGECGGLERLETRCRENRLDDFDLLASQPWQRFAAEVQLTCRQNDHAIVRGLAATEDGASLLVAALALSRNPRTYRGGKVVKKFRMSPWTADLSHTTREGDFHTDLNTEPEPPALTAIQCLEPDPGAPAYGQNRIARLGDLLRYLEDRGRHEALRFLHAAPVTMVSSRNRQWTGTIVEGGQLRYHPATLRAAEQLPEVTAQLEAMIGEIHQTALAVSTPFDLRAGDLFVVSNRRALHYRGECSVAFTRFPTEYRARAIFVLHLQDEAG